MSFKKIEGNLFDLVEKKQFDIIAHGCNCFCTMAKGIAVEFNKRFNCNDHRLFPLEHLSTKGDINKLGQIQARNFVLNPQDSVAKRYSITVINCYTQYKYNDVSEKPFDYDAFKLCLKKINHKYAGMRIGLPLIGGHLAGGDRALIEMFIEIELKDCDVTLVIFKP